MEDFFQPPSLLSLYVFKMDVILKFIFNYMSKIHLILTCIFNDVRENYMHFGQI